MNENEFEYKANIVSTPEGQKYDSDSDAMVKRPKEHTLKIEVGPEGTHHLARLEKLKTQIQNLILLSGGQTTLDDSLNEITELVTN